MSVCPSGCPLVLSRTKTQKISIKLQNLIRGITVWIRVHSAVSKGTWTKVMALKHVPRFKVGHGRGRWGQIHLGQKKTS